MRDIPKKGERYRHFKGGEYEIIAVARHTESMEELVVYSPLESRDKVFARPLPMFMSEVDRNKYPEVKQEFRFEKIADSPVTETDGDELEGVSPLLLEFLDAETYAEKLIIFDRMKMSVTDDIIDSIAVSLDTEVGKGPIEERYRQIKDILLMQEEYETTRLRG